MRQSYHCAVVQIRVRGCWCPWWCHILLGFLLELDEPETQVSFAHVYCDYLGETLCFGVFAPLYWIWMLALESRVIVCG